MPGGKRLTKKDKEAIFHTLPVCTKKACIEQMDRDYQMHIQSGKGFFSWIKSAAKKIGGVAKKVGTEVLKEAWKIGKPILQETARDYVKGKMKPGGAAQGGKGQSGGCSGKRVAVVEIKPAVMGRGLHPWGKGLNPVGKGKSKGKQKLSKMAKARPRDSKGRFIKK